MWVDFINSNVAPAVLRLIACSKDKDPKIISIATGELKNALACIESHLKLRNFLVGHSLTLADAFLVNTLQVAFTNVVDKRTRDGSLPNLSRYVSLILSMPTFQTVYGPINFCVKLE